MKSLEKILKGAILHFSCDGTPNRFTIDSYCNIKMELEFIQREVFYELISIELPLARKDQIINELIELYEGLFKIEFALSRY